MVPGTQGHSIHVEAAHDAGYGELRQADMRMPPDDDSGFYDPDRRTTRWLVMIIIILTGTLANLTLYHFVLHH